MKRWPLDKDTFCQLCGVQEESENIFGSAPSFEPPTSWRDWKRFVHIWKGPNRPYVVDIICFHLRARRARIKQRRFRHQGSCIAVAVDRQNIIGWDRAYQGMRANGWMKYRRILLIHWEFAKWQTVVDLHHSQIIWDFLGHVALQLKSLQRT